MTDKETLNATAATRIENDNIYEFILKCDGTRRVTTIGTYTPDAEPRSIMWEGSVWTTNSVYYIESRGFRYRIDDRMPRRSLLSPVYSNVGKLDSMFREGLPNTTLLIADVFPNEVAEFPFGVLTADERRAIERICYASERAAAETASREAAAEAAATADPSGAYRLGGGVTVPRLLKQVNPKYTLDAMRAKIQGTVLLEVVVLSDGSVGDVGVVRSLDEVFGLDAEAIKSVKQWRFVPGTRFGEPVPVVIAVELSFTLRQ